MRQDSRQLGAEPRRGCAPRAHDLASCDEGSSSWVAEAGTHRVEFGASVTDIRQRCTFELDKDLSVKKVNAALTPMREIHRIHL